MAHLFADTTPEAEAVLVGLLAQASPAHKVRMVDQLNASLWVLLRTGLRQRFPQAGRDELHRRMAGMLLSEAVASRLYGPVQPAAQTSVEVQSPPMNQPAIEVTLKVTAVLEALDVPYVLVGSLASAIYGTPRATLDSDLVAALRPEHVDDFVRTLQDEFYVSPPAIREALEHHSSFNLIHLGTMFKVDVFVAQPRPFDTRQLTQGRLLAVAEDPERTAVADAALTVASPEDTILARLEQTCSGGASAEWQWRDVLAIIATQGALLDMDYMRQGAVELGVTDLLDRALSARAG